MRSTAISREVWRNVTTGTTWTLTLGLIATGLLTGICLLDLATIHRLNQNALEFQQSLGSVQSIQAPGRIDGVACEALNRLPGVRAAGALRPAQTNLSPAALPRSSMQTYETTASVPAVLRTPNLDRVGIYLSSGAVETLGIQPGDEIAFATGKAILAGAYQWDETDGRRPGFGYAALILTADNRPFDECWADIWPMSEATTAQLKVTVLPPGSSTVTEATPIGQLNPSKGKTYDGEQLFQSRNTKYAPVAVAVLGFLIGYASMFRRRLELASARHAGVTKTDLLLTSGLEALTWVVPAALLVIPGCAWLVTLSQPEDRLGLIWTATTTTLSGGASAIFGVLVVVALTKERHLIQFFKNRQ